MKARRWHGMVGLGAGLALGLFSTRCALAQGAPSSSTDGGAASESIDGCVESVPEGARRPVLRDTFPSRGLSGYIATLHVEVEHGKGETVLPRGIDLQSQGDAAKALKAAGFVVPLQDGGAGARLFPSAQQPSSPERVSTTLELPLVPLPKEVGRHTMRLPAVPVAVARASGELMTLCTRSHSIVVELPTAQTPDPEPHANPSPLPQREEWTALKRAVQVGALGIVLGGLLAYALHRWLNRPRPAPPPPPPRPPWDVALEKLDEIRHAGLIDVARYGEYFDRVSDAIRGYLGAVGGFDGLESTTDEVLAALQKNPLPGITVAELQLFLQDCDLVKFANLTPTRDDCVRILSAGEHIVHCTMPRSLVAPTVDSREGGTAP